MIQLQGSGKGHDFPTLHFLHTKAAEGSPGGCACSGMSLESPKNPSVTPHCKNTRGLDMGNIF